MMKAKRIIGAVLLTGLLLTFALAAAAAGTSYPYVDEDGTLKTTAAPVTVIAGSKAGETLSDGWYIVLDSGVTRTSTITIGGDVHLILADGASLSVTGTDDNPGINVNGRKLTIYSQSLGTGKLTAVGGTAASGIDEGFSNGTLTINGGEIIASGGSCTQIGDGGAGIGMDGAAVNINGGTVTASGTNYCPGIGSGHAMGAAAHVTISGGTVRATGGLGGAGIGSSVNASGGTVSISGGTVIATGGDDGAGIGNGINSSGGTVSVSGGTVIATGGENGAGIGGGGGSDGANINISGGTVTAKGGSRGAGIGGGAGDESGGTVHLSGGTVTATGGSQGAGIGGGYNGGSGEVYVTGGTVKVTGDTAGGAQNIGHGAGSDTSVGVLMDKPSGEGGVNVFLTCITLSGVSEKEAVTSLTTNATYYGIKDLSTDAGGRIYLYLPQGTVTMGAGTPSKKYEGLAVTIGSPYSYTFDESVGREIELRADGTYVQWRYQDEAQWHNLIALSDIKGAQGAAGENGTNGKPGTSGAKAAPGASGTDGKDGAAGNGIASIVKTGTDGSVDTYTISFTDGTASTFTVPSAKEAAGTAGGTDTAIYIAAAAAIAALLSHLGWLIPLILRRKSR